MSSAPIQQLLLTAMNVAGRYNVPNTEKAFIALPSLLLCSVSFVMISPSLLAWWAMSLRISMSLCSATTFLVKLSLLRYSRILKSYVAWLTLIRLVHGHFLDSQGLKCPWIAQECWQHFFGESLAVLNTRLVLTIDSSPRDPACC